jgi:hypothetical protein
MLLTYEQYRHDIILTYKQYEHDILLTYKLYRHNILLPTVDDVSELSISL